MKQGTEVGIGRALRKARFHRELTLEEASRGTRMRAEYLDALEREAFDELPGDAYARGFLRSYASFLGLDPDKVAGVYERTSAGAPAAPTPRRGPRRASVLPGGRHHFPWPMAVGVAAIVFIAAGAFGLLSRSASTPEPAEVSTGMDLQALPETVTVSVVAQHDVRVQVTADGASVFDEVLAMGEAHTFEANDEIVLWLESGASARVRVNGRGLGVPGDPTRPYSNVYRASDFRGDRSASNG